MRKAALFSTLVVLGATFQMASAQDIYIRYDADCVEKLEYRFVEHDNGVAYTAYKVNKNATENVYFETGVEVPQIRKTAPSKMYSCNAIDLSKADVNAINKGKRKAFIVKKLDSGWAVLPVGSAAYMSFTDNIINYTDATSDFQADLRTAANDNDLSLDKSEENAKAAVFYIGEMTACNFTAYQFKKTPRQTCKEDATIAILPGLGLIQDFATGGQRFELVGINNTDVCGYYSTPTTPAPVMAEPQPDVPQTYNIVAQAPPPQYEVADSDVSRSDDLGGSDVASKSVEPEPACLTIATEGEHIVQRGESLYGIARRYGLTVSSLREWNDLKEDMIYPCSPLKVIAPSTVAAVEPPAPEPSMEEKRQNDIPQSYVAVVKPKSLPKPAPVKINCNVEAGEGEHVVMQGESLYGIARTYNLKVADLRAWNGLKEDVIQPCQKMVVVEPAEKAVPVSYSVIPKAKPAGPKVEFKAASSKTSVKVAPQKIAQKAAAAKIAAAPKAVKVIEKPQPVQPFIAKTVTITAKSVPNKQTVSFVKKGSGLHVVKKGETISNLAKETNMTEGEFRKLNNLSKSETISVGQVLRMENCACNVSVDADNSLTLKPIPVSADIVGDVPTTYNTVVKPKKAPTTEGAQLMAKSVDNRSTRKYHIAQQNETVASIAKTYKKKIEDIRALNRFDENEVIVPNQLILLE
jgi:LysM repeat protein